jgi:hypothetical protein
MQNSPPTSNFFNLSHIYEILVGNNYVKVRIYFIKTPKNTGMAFFLQKAENQFKEKLR